jgi:long-chain acyl-CoA synthetase
MYKELRDLKEIVIDRFEEYGDKEAIYEKNKETGKFESITYKELKEKILSFGTVLYEKFKLRDEKIAVIGENSSKWYITYMATVCGLGVIVPLDKELPSNEILSLLKRSKAKVIVYSSKKKDIINEIKKDLDNNIIFIEMDKTKEEKDVYYFDELLKEGKELLDTGHHEYLNLEIDKFKFAVLLFTSGTTAASKGVMLCHNNLTTNIYAGVLMFDKPIKSRFLSILPMHHTYEFTTTYLAALSEGGSVGICEGLKYLASNFKEVKPQVLICVPLLIENLRKKIEKSIREANKENIVGVLRNVTGFINSNKLKRIVFKQIHQTLGGELKYILSGAAPIDKDTIEFMKSLGFVILQGYGLTETSPLISGTYINDIEDGTVGKPGKGIEVRIDLKEDEIENSGEIMVKGPNVMLGYYENEEETNKVLKKGWFYTGDIGYFNNNGNLVISGRTKNVIVTANGKNIYPEEIENYINKIPFIKESLVYGELSSNKKEDPTVSVKVTLDEDYIEEKYTSNRPSDKEIYDIIWEKIKEINRSLVSYKAVKKLIIKKGDFEKTTTMKIKRFKEANKD